MGMTRGQWLLSCTRHRLHGGRHLARLIVNPSPRSWARCALGSDYRAPGTLARSVVAVRPQANSMHRDQSSRGTGEPGPITAVPRLAGLMLDLD